MADLSTEICGVRLRNTTVLLSGIVPTSTGIFQKYEEAGAGAVTGKSTNLAGRKGHPYPNLLVKPTFSLNAIGLSNPGVEKEVEELTKAVQTVKIPVFGSIFGDTIENFGTAAELMNKTGVPLLEVDISCPNNSNDADMQQYKNFASDPKVVAKVTELVKSKSRVPVSIKLSPNVTDIAVIAKAAEEAGADALTVINTAKGMNIDLKTRKPYLSNKMGGVGGASLHPIAIRCIWEVYKTVKIPIMGSGGILTGEDAVEMLMAGATTTGVGSAIYYNKFEAFRTITAGMDKWLGENGFTSAKQLVGIAHQ